MNEDVMTGIQHADIIKGLHKSLREKIKHGEEADQVWSNLLRDKQILDKYAHSMHMLAKNHWQQGSSSCRVTWSYMTSLSYFHAGGNLKVIKKREKTKKFSELRENALEENYEERNKINNYIDLLKLEMFCTPTCDQSKLVLLDVGSCFNPFKDFEEFSVIAIDISPATDDVLYCDFSNLNVSEGETCLDFELDDNDTPTLDELMKTVKKTLQNGIAVLGFFDVVTFSLLLSYFPTPLQRFQCCVKANKSLKLYGLLIIITPDSSHQTKHTGMMKSWNTALQTIGFTRYKYEKLQHLHCMAFWKSSNIESVDYTFSNYMYIPQDNQNYGSDEENLYDGQSDNKVSNEVYDVDVFSNMDLI